MFDPLIAGQARRIDMLLRRVCRGLDWDPDASLLEDCRQEAAIRLWKARHRLAALPPPDRRKYADRCIVRAVWPLLQDESERRSWLTSLDGLRMPDGSPVELPDLRTRGNDTYFAGSLLHQVCDPDLARALRGLPPAEYDLLELAYLHHYTDGEVARLRRTSVRTVGRQRHGILAKLRRRVPAESPLACQPRARRGRSL